MPKGGARAVSGPPPDPNSLRQARAANAAGWSTLPAEGRTGPVPQWPLVSMQPREADLWEDMWARPQAVMWERLGQEIEVAMFCRKLAEAELPKASVELQKVVRQYLDSLGLSVQGMLRNRWRIEPAAAEDPAEASVKPTARRRSARDRLKVVPSGEGA
ncbi:hypothetical protein [Streptomyces sp. MK5]|uniref:phage terminase small subunit n=1 Tax=Streptomyces sp. MK5 TaxID=3064253 RepID=UPI002741E466|nr:hypothetical protein [Streptomyces sp. MK5]